MKILVLLLISFLLISCGGENNEVPDAKTAQGQKSEYTKTGSERSGFGGGSTRGGTNEFLIETKTIGELGGSESLSKIGQILPNNSFTIKAQVNGNVSNIAVNEGETIQKGQSLIFLSDDYSRYTLDLERAQIEYDKQIIAKDSQLLNINKNIDDTKRNLDDAKRLYENAKVTAEEKKKLAKIQFENANTQDSNSQAYLELEKSKLDYENLINQNAQTIDSYIRDVQEEYNNLVLNLTDIIDFGEELFGFNSDDNDLSDRIDEYFGVRNMVQKGQTKELLRELIIYNQGVSNINPLDVSEENMIEFLSTYQDGYSKISVFLNSLETTVNNSINSIGSLSESEIDTYISRVNSFQNSNQGDLSSYNSLLRGINNFIKTYKDEELIALKDLEIKAKNYQDNEQNSSSDYTKELINIENELASVKKSYESIQAAYDNLLESKEISIRSLDNSIQSSFNSLKQARTDLAKLNVTSPISGIVQSIEVNEGENINSGNDLIKIISNSTTKIDVSLSQTEIKDIQISDTVEVEFNNNKYEGIVFSISKVADEALNYNVEIQLNENFGFVGGSAKVNFSQKLSNINIPLNIVDIIGDDIGTINFYESGSLQLQEVELGNISGNNIEILSYIPENIQIITTDLDNFNSNTQTLSIKQ